MGRDGSLVMHIFQIMGIDESAIMHIGVSWRIRLNHPCAARSDPTRRNLQKSWPDPTRGKLCLTGNEMSIPVKGNDWKVTVCLALHLPGFHASKAKRWASCLPSTFYLLPMQQASLSSWENIRRTEQRQTRAATMTCTFIFIAAASLSCHCFCHAISLMAQY